MADKNVNRFVQFLFVLSLNSIPLYYEFYNALVD